MSNIFAINTWTWPKKCMMCQRPVSNWKDAKCIEVIGICCECAEDIESKDGVLMEEMRNSFSDHLKQERNEKYR